jgi:hypothetical protein
LPPAPGKIGPLKRDPATGGIVPAGPPANAGPTAPESPRTPVAVDGLPPAAKPKPSMPGASQAAIGDMHVCLDLAQHAACRTTSLQEALDKALPGGSVVLHPGSYRQAAYVRRDGTRLIALDGATLVGETVGGKAALVVQADGVAIEGLGCARIAVPDENGACVRHEGGDLVLRNVHFRDSEHGVLAGKGTGTLLIENSRFENLGKAGRAHGVYASGSALTIRGSLFLAARDEGHEIKSRAATTLIENSLVASLDGRDSYLIDIPDGGTATIRNNLLQEGPKSSNESAIAFGLEGIAHDVSSLAVTGNLFLVAKPNTRLVRAAATNARFEDNIVIGRRGHYTPGNVTAGCGDRGNVCADDITAVLDRLRPLPIPGSGGVIAREKLLN